MTTPATGSPGALDTGEPDAEPSDVTQADMAANGFDLDPSAIASRRP